MTRNWFERLFIVAQKLRAGIRPLKFPESSTAVGLSSNRWTWETKELPKLNEGTPWALKSQGWVTRRQTRVVAIWPIKPDHKVDQTRESKSSFSPEEPKSKILRGYCGGQLIPCVQTALEEARPNIQSHMYSQHKKGPGPISSLRIREYPRTTSKGRDESYTPRRGKECLWRIWPCPRTIATSELLS